ncbi:peroxiredoxin [Gillisia sp. M10.2A]|uniref:thioredoxin-dependent peroxiredoxin n=1 Tax=Gillisia lutea TaxID=2909668 RepID=A0ABS9EDM5_9FLAO|nr:peroxiredoxin [Gillisia lutea]MCF4100986.1 peroxiredoxin [Gillisia lutea]
MSLEIGDTIPALQLKDKDGNDFQLDQFKNIKPVVIYFYPKNFTPGCTKEACGFRDKYQDFKDLGAEVIAISSDSEASHSKFVEKYSLPFIFLSDEHKQARKAFGVKSALLGLIPGRETFVFDKEGKLQFRYNNLNASQHTSLALKHLKELS